MQFFKFMTSKKVFIIFSLSLVFIGFSQLCQANLVVIGNPSIKISSLTKEELTNLYLGKPVSLSTKERLNPYDQSANSKNYQDFYKALMGWGPSDLAGYWSSRVFTGQANQPASIRTDQEAIATIEQTPNAIAYVDTQSLQNVTVSQVKVLYGNVHLVADSGTPTQTLPKPAAVTGNAAALGYHSIDQGQSIASIQKDSSTQLNNDISKQLDEIHNNLTGGTNVWAAIQANIQFGPEVNNPEVRRQILWYLDHRSVLNMIINNSAPFIYYVFQETQKRHMPAMFALLPLIESGYDPYAYSRAGAAGLWQMMPGTASSYGLDIDWWYDGRRDVMTSTSAGLNFLMELKQGLGDWYLAAAGYDAGQGAVQAAMQMNLRSRRSTDFWSLPLSEETREYVPRLLALAAIIKNPSQYNVQLPEVPNQPFFTAIRMSFQLDIEEISKLSDVSIDLIRRLNPGIRRWATPPDGQYTLLIPASNVQTFTRNLARVAGRTHLSWQYHEVHQGETLQLIAKNYHADINAILTVNDLKSADEVQPQQGILVPIRLNKAFQHAMGIVWPSNASSMTQTAAAQTNQEMLLPDSLESVDSGLADIQKEITQTKPYENPSLNTVKNTAEQAPVSVNNSKPLSETDSLKTLIHKIYGHD